MFLYTNSEKSEREIKETVLQQHHCNKKNKIPSSKPTQGDRDLHAENCKALMEGTRPHKQMERQCHVLGLAASILSKRLGFPKQSTDSMQSHGIFHTARTNNFKTVSFRILIVLQVCAQEWDCWII